MSRRAWVVIGALLVVAVALVVALVASWDRPTVSVPTVALQTPPPPAGSTTPTVATVVLPMGHLADPANTFYELFDRSAGSPTWTLSTPPGVADNGGLVVGPSSGGVVTAGFLPSADLTFSVLATRAPGASQWSPAELPGTLAAEPDGLATGPAGQTAAVLSSTGTPVLAAGPGATTWHRLVSAAELTEATGGCRVTRVSAVAVTTSGLPVVGARCTGADVGLFEPASPATASSPDLPAPGRWVRVGPSLGSSGVTATTVLRLQDDGPGVAGLVETSGAGRSSVVAVWDPAGGTATISAPLTVPTGWTVQATATGGNAGPGLAVLLRGPAASDVRLTTVAGPGGAWSSPGPPPAGTSAVATVGDEVDAFVPAGAELRIWAATGSGPWHRTADLIVPIQYGSSS